MICAVCGAWGGGGGGGSSTELPCAAAGAAGGVAERTGGAAGGCACGRVERVDRAPRMVGSAWLVRRVAGAEVAADRGRRAAVGRRAAAAGGGGAPTGAGADRPAQRVQPGLSAV